MGEEIEIRHCIMNFNRAEMASRHMVRSAFKVSLLSSSARTQIQCPNMPVLFLGS